MPTEVQHNPKSEFFRCSTTPSRPLSMKTPLPLGILRQAALTTIVEALGARFQNRTLQRLPKSPIIRCGESMPYGLVGKTRLSESIRTWRGAGWADWKLEAIANVALCGLTPRNLQLCIEGWDHLPSWQHNYITFCDGTTMHVTDTQSRALDSTGSTESCVKLRNTTTDHDGTSHTKHLIWSACHQHSRCVTTSATTTPRMLLTLEQTTWAAGEKESCHESHDFRLWIWKASYNFTHLTFEKFMNGKIKSLAKPMENALEMLSSKAWGVRYAWCYSNYRTETLSRTYIHTYVLAARIYRQRVASAC